jgi:glutaredoxin
MGVLCPYCNEKPEGFKQKGALRMHIMHKHREKYDEFVKENPPLQKVEPERLQQLKQSVDMSDWDDYEVEDYLELDAEYHQERLQSKIAKEKYKQWKYNNPQTFHQLTQPVINSQQSQQQLGVKEIIEIMNLMNSQTQRSSLKDLREMMSFVQELPDNKGGSDPLEEMIMPLLLQNPQLLQSFVNKGQEKKPQQISSFPPQSLPVIEAGKPLNNDNVTTIPIGEDGLSEDEPKPKAKKTGRAKK